MANKAIYELLGNNSFNLQILNETLWDIKENSFGTLYNAQKKISGIERYDIDMADYNMDSYATESVYNINCQFLDEAYRLTYRKSRYYKKDINISTLYSNPNIFGKLIFIFINGHMYTNYNIRLNDDRMLLVFPLGVSDSKFTRSEFERIVYAQNNITNHDPMKTYNIGDHVRYFDDNGNIKVFACIENTTGKFDTNVWIPAYSTSKMTVLVVPVCSVAYDNTTLNNYVYNDDLRQYGGLKLERFNGDYKNNIEYDDHVLAFMTDWTYRYRYELIDGEIKTITTNKGTNRVLTMNKSQIHPSVGDYSIEVSRLTYLFHMMNFMSKIVVPKGEKYFELAIKDMPIPKENMLIFKRVKIYENQDYYYMQYDHKINVNMYYPNIYELVRPDNDDYDVVIYTYYSDDTVSVGNKYDNELQLYHRFTTNILDKYKDNTIPEIIKDYNPIEVAYSINDYKKSDYYDESIDGDVVYENDHLSYKMNKFKSLVSQNGEFYRAYLTKLIGYLPIFDVNADDIYTSENNFASRRRTHNRNEIHVEASQKDFDEDRYLFVFRYDTNNENLTLFLDNYAYYPDEIYRDEKYIYIYIPTRFINTEYGSSSSTTIRVEKLNNTTFRQNLESTTDEYIHIHLPKELHISVNDLFISYIHNGSEKYVINSEPADKYEIYIRMENKNGEIEYILSDDTSFFKYEDIYIKIIDESLKDKELYILANRINFTKFNIGNNVFTINDIINNNTDNILVFKNGRLVPEKYLSIQFNENINGPHTVRTLVNVDDTDEFILMYSQNKYRQVYYSEEIHPKGYINLEGLIDKPIDLKWHDIYLNGLKLTEKNIDLLTPYSFLINNVDSRYNLMIFEKNLDSDIFDPSTTYDSINDNILDIINNQILNDRDDIDPDNNSDNIMNDSIIDLIGFIDRYLLNIGLINPDIQQITQEMIDGYPNVFDENNNLFINPDLNLKIDRNVFINPSDYVG